MNQEFQLIIQDGGQELLGPFGRLFIGDFPTKGTLWIIAFAILFDFMIAGGWISFLLLSIITIFLTIYFCYNYIEPHFNSRIGVEREKKLSGITRDSDHLAMGDIGRLLHGYGKSAVEQVWDLSGKGSLREAFEGVPSDFSAEQKSVGASDKTWVSWLILLTFLIVWWVALQIGGLGIFLALYLVGISEGLAMSVAGLLVCIIVIPLTLLFIYVDGSLDRIKEMLRFGSVKRTLILILAIPIVATIINFVLTVIYIDLWIGIFGEPSINTDVGTYWESSSIEIAFLFLSVAIVTPIVEELMLRGYILDAINRKHSDWTAIICSSILFGLLHVFGGAFYIGSTLMGGIIYGWIRVRTGSLLPSIAGHMMWNLMALSLNYL